jgi:hypothetical protein
MLIRARKIHTLTFNIATTSIAPLFTEDKKGPLRTKNLSSSLKRSLKKSVSNLRPLALR